MNVPALAVLILAFVPGPLPGFQQGSFFIFDIIEGVSAEEHPASAPSARIRVAKSIFKESPQGSDARLAGERKRSEFEADLNTLSPGEDGLAAGLTESLKPKVETGSKDSSFGDSSFDEDTAPKSGFFFSF